MAEEPTTHDKAEPKTVKLAVAWPHTEHTHGDLVITQQGTEVPASKAKAIIESAAAVGSTVREV